ncbi:hypothetical protein AK812_SmicGene25282 [Symbiodinium microadriaticum]|uniref:Uncharacterized protein n=1 Tax=Symbiodinium microadriaticum TaxID=2951 RepID=A0A1Q9DCB6_SYMMI|nr:hypothetical protein AK812_SmicGene25282 [Symbiodinium microadriaticum]
MDLTGSMSMSPNGNVVLRPRAGEAPESSPWVLDDEPKDGNGRQSRRSPYQLHEFNSAETRTGDSGTYS